MKQDGSPRLGFKHRLMFYVGGFVFATTSYIVGLWAYGAESAGSGDVVFYRHLLRNLFEAAQNHTVTFFVWEVICVGIAVVVGHSFDREVYYRRRAEQKANVDGLTEIYNHRYFQDRLGAEIDRACRYDRLLSLVMLDIDDFKSFNDTWGHQEGDRLLKWFATVCTNCIRSIDIPARYGGEEFAIILPETDRDEALGAAERIRETTEKQSQAVFGKNRGVTVSAGVASYPAHGRTRHALVLNSDAALYYAKQGGKNRCCVYEDKCHQSYRATPEHVKAMLGSEDDMEAIEALGAAVDARDTHSKGHSTSVMQFSLALGETLGLSAEELDNLRAAALLHDIGKIGTPEELFDKQGPLGADEWKRVEDHAGMGSRLLRRMQQMSSILPGVKHHHERFDGKGYPSGLSGKSIPLLARVIAIADAFDAMTNNRSYRGAMSKEDAIAELRRCAGEQFDPELVELFIAGVEQAKQREEAA